MKFFTTSIKDNKVVLFWMTIFILYLSFKTDQALDGGSLLSGAIGYLVSEELGILLPALGATLSIAFPVTLIILALTLSLASLSYFKPWLAAVSGLFLGISILPTVYFIFLARLIMGSSTDSSVFLVFALAFSNLILFFFYLDFRKELHDEFNKEYHHLSRQLGVKSLIISSRKKIGLLALERFRPLFILVFSSTVFAEHKLSVSGGIYFLFFRTAKTISGRPDIFYGQLMLILLFVILFLVCYDTLSNFLKEKYY